MPSAAAISNPDDDRTGDHPTFALALMTGGSSRRMGAGRHKALLPWPPPEGPSLIQHQWKKLTELGNGENPPMLSCKKSQADSYLANGIPESSLVFDAYENSGPLAGLAACLKVARSRGFDFVLLLAIDLPLMPASFPGRLIGQALLDGKGIVPHLDGRWQPLCALYPTSLADQAETNLAAGDLSLQNLVNSAERSGHIAAFPVTDGQRHFFQNINTPGDYHAAAATLGSAGLKIEKHRLDVGSIWRHHETHDEVAAEEPLEIRVEGTSVAVVMRTPGHDQELAAGFLLTEGVAKSRADFFEISQCPSVDPDSDIPDESRGNVIDVLLGGEAKARDLSQLTRHVFTSSSCGICGKATIESVFQSFPPITDNAPKLHPDLLLELPHRLRDAQNNFRRTGGLHASALFDATSGELLLVREDVGRHNALDKVVGHAVLNGLTPLSNTVLLLSGRISFELMQKALAAGIPIVAGISAPSSLAVNFARESGQTLVGFLRDESFNVYAG